MKSTEILSVWDLGLYSLWRGFRYNEILSMHATLSFSGLKNLDGYFEDFVLHRFVQSRFHCI